MLTQWFAIVCMATLMVSHAKSEELQCPKECTCQDKSNETIITMSCKSLNQYEKINIPIINFELFQNDNITKEPIRILANTFFNMGLENVRTITITNSSIFSIDKDAFKGLKILKTVRIMHTNITEIHPDTFQSNEELKTLYLHNLPLNKFDGLNSDHLTELVMSKCHLKEIRKEMFENLSYIETLNLEGNQIKKLTEGIFDPMSDLNEIHLENNEISHIPENVFNNDLGVELLYLDGNPIKTVKNINVENLETLSLKNCLVKTIDDDSFNGLENLLNLDLSENQISKISKTAFTKLTYLETINLSHNNLQDIDRDMFFNNVRLEKIVFDDNVNITKLPLDGFRHNKSIRTFNVYHFSCQNCGLKYVAEKTFITMEALVTLKLSHNKISDIRSGVFNHLPYLNEIDISYNQIVSMDDTTFMNNINLMKLNLAGNPLKTLHPSIFKHNHNLKDLDLHSCGLPSLWTGEKEIKLGSIQNINISDNHIILITLEDIKVTEGLKYIDLSGNDLSCTDSYKTLVEYLTDKEIKDTQYRTNEELTIDNKDETVEEMNVASMGIWKEQAKIKCPNLQFTDETHSEKEIQTTNLGKKVTPEDVDNANTKLEIQTSKVGKKVTTEDYEKDEEDEDEDDDEDEDEDEEDETVDDDNNLTFGESDNITMYVRTKYEKYSYMWLTLIFLGVSLVTLGVVANLILFIIRRRQMIEVPRINIRPISKLKKNSGLVYQQLSEEKDGQKTPVLSRFIPIPSVHAPNAPQYV